MCVRVRVHWDGDGLDGLEIGGWGGCVLNHPPVSLWSSCQVVPIIMTFKIFINYLTDLMSFP